jgi:ubiquinone/menaquinone biosynthesis C-methylase UbiE
LSTAREPGLLGDTSARSYEHKLDLFTLHAEPELREILQWIPVQAGSSVLDAGCGTGWVTVWIAEICGRNGLTVGMDLARSHVERARENISSAGSSAVRLVQADLARVPFGPGRFDGIWIGNTLNHLRDPVGGLSSVSELVQPGGWIAVGQSHALPEMIFAWDERLERSVTAACRQYYRQKYGLNEHDTSGVRRLFGIVQEAGLQGVQVRTVVIERTSPLSELDEEYYRRVLFEGNWGSRVEPFLSAADREELKRLCDPSHAHYALRRTDFHAAETYTVVFGRVA